jgi:hypothetical protein
VNDHESFARGPWLKAPWSAERAANLILWFGRHKGRSVGELATTSNGRVYLRWLAQNLDNNAAIVARISLGLVQPEEVPP